MAMLFFSSVNFSANCFFILSLSEAEAQIALREASNLASALLIVSDNLSDISHEAACFARDSTSLTQISIF
jgi:hypothetical protein